MPESESHTARVRAEFERTADTFARRTRGRFADLGVVEFSRVVPGSTVAEVGAGTGNFLSLFAGVAGPLLAVDITPAMLHKARADHPVLEPVVADGSALPFVSRSIDLVGSAQTLHHLWTPLDVLKEMARVMKADGHVLIVDQTAPERYEEAEAMNVMEILRDPSHAVARPASALRILVRAAGLEIVDEKKIEATERFSDWMWPEEFPPDRMAAVRDFIEKHGADTGMGFQREGDDWTFVRTRIMLLAGRPGAPGA